LSPSAFLSLKVARLKQKAKRKRIRSGVTAPEEWKTWLTTLYPSYVYAPFAERHEELWQWAWAIEKDVRPRPFVAIWPRGGAKSTSAELIAVAWGARKQRKYLWYICETQDQADKHVETIAALLESEVIEKYYPDMAEREVGKFGNVRGWRRQRLRAANGFTIDALGIDRASRGAKVEEQRPDAMIFDDIDDKLDSVLTTEKKMAVMTSSLMPAGSNDLAVLAIQNLVIPNGVFSQLRDGRADLLRDRIISGPYPAIENFAFEQHDGEFVITGGTPTWLGQDLEVCQNQIRTWGLTAFRSEAQHEVDDPPGGMFNHLIFRHCRWDELPDLVRTTVWVDPAVTDSDKSDSMGIQADGLAADRTIYRLWSWEQITSPEDALRRAILKALELGADTVGVETDQGGDAWRSVFNEAWRHLLDDGLIDRNQQKPRFKQAKAGSGEGPKVHRASQMLTAYEQGRFVHVLGTHETLERALYRFPAAKPFDLVDACFWSWTDLAKGGWARA
jgi:hypothetical protein